MMELSRKDARKLFLQRQGLMKNNAFGRGKNAVARTIDRLGYLQIDTISVINRAHEHILAARIDHVNPDHLQTLMKQRQLFEYWSHAAAFLPFEDYRFYLPVMLGWRQTRECDRQLARDIKARIRSEGPLSSRHFEDTRPGQGNGWWDWKPAKQVLEHLFLGGELMVSHREKFQKVYDLPENVVPSSVDTSHPDEDELAGFLVRRMVNALGVARERDIGYAKSTIRRLAKLELKQSIARAISRLVESGELIEVSVAGELYYSTSALVEQLPLRAAKGRVRLLSPFDNLVINRARTSELFGFDYQLECYLPAPKRQYGYFALPLLYGDELIGRLDAKADRKNGVLRVNSLHLEPAVRPDDRLVACLAEGIHHFAHDHASERIELDRCDPPNLKSALQAELWTSLHRNSYEVNL